MVVLVKLSSIYRMYWNRWGYPWDGCTCKTVFYIWNVLK